MIQALDGFRNSNNGEGTVYIKEAEIVIITNIHELLCLENF